VEKFLINHFIGGFYDFIKKKKKKKKKEKKQRKKLYIK